MKSMNYKIDASGIALGRTASKAAHLLMGKNDASFANNTVSSNKVHIENASKMKLSFKKLTTTMHEKYTGYPGGFSRHNIEEIIAKKGHQELFKKAVYGMLPSNKLRPKMMKNLTITD
jgi:large subunit ribosomal protein L13